MSEEPDTAQFRAWLHPRSSTRVKTVCIIAQRSPDPSAIGSKADADTATCKASHAPTSAEPLGLGLALWRPTEAALIDIERLRQRLSELRGVLL